MTVASIPSTAFRPPKPVPHDGPIGMFLLSPFAKGEGKNEFTNSIHYDHGSTLKTIQEIFNVKPFLGSAAGSSTSDLRDLFQ